MLKLIDLDSSYFQDEPLVKLINLDKSSTNGLVKRAADSQIDAFVSDLKPEPNKIYVHILAMGAGEYYGANRNADFFPEENLKKFHDTFVTSPAHIFKHHINKNPDIAIGRVVFSFYNDRMHRVEVIAWVDRDKGYDYVKRIEAGEFPATSMACHTPYDTCSVCGNRAKSRSEYCVHLRTELGKIMPDGRKVMSINDGPLRFFDQSFVFKPADVTSSVLQKVAFAKSEPVLGSAENAEMHSLVEKAAEIKKLSELIKEIEGNVVGSSKSLQSILDLVKDPDDSVIETLVKYDLHHVIHALSELGICPSVEFFAKLIGRKIAGENVGDIGTLISGLLREEPGSVSVPQTSIEKVSEVSIPCLAKFYKQSSLFPEAIMGRAITRDYNYVPSDFSGTGNVGYIGNGPHVEPDPREVYKTLKMNLDKESPGLLKTLFMIGGAAVAAKWLLSRMIDAKMQEQRANSPVKIVLVKSAEEAFTTQQLVKASFLRNMT